MQESSVRLGVVMDPIETIKPEKDSTFAMLLEAQARGWQIFYMRQADLRVRDGAALAIARALKVRDEPAGWFTLGTAEETPLETLDAIFMRKDPPFDMEYIYTTYLLEQAAEAGAVVVNDPQALRDVNEKAFIARFPECAPPTLIAREIRSMQSFLDEHRRIVVKPLDGMGGRSIFVVSEDDGNRNVILETITGSGTRFAMAQAWLPAIVSSGDKRILLIDGQPVPYALARIPVQGEHRGNLVMGARGEGRELTERDRWICARVGPELARRGVLFAGLDVIGDHLTEINITSPTGIREIDRAFSINVSGSLLDAVEARLAG
ncbi:glutathione synthase [soil metagenome]